MAAALTGCQAFSFFSTDFANIFFLVHRAPLLNKLFYGIVSYDLRKNPEAKSFGST